MADPPPYRESKSATGGETSVGSDGDSPTGAPRWVKVFAIVAVIVVLLFVILMFARGPGGRHGPGRHMSVGNAGGRTPSSSVIAVHASPSGRS